MDEELSKEILDKYLSLLEDDAGTEGVIRLQHAQDNVEYLMEYLSQRDSLESGKEVLALESRKDDVEWETVPRRDPNVMTPNASVKTIPAGHDRFQVTETGLVLQRRTLHRQSVAGIHSSKFEVVTVRRFGDEPTEGIVKSISDAGEGSLLVKHGGALAWTTPKQMVLEFRGCDAAFLFVRHVTVETSIVQSGRPFSTKLRSLIDAGDDMDSTKVSILQLDQSKTLLHVLETPGIRQRNNFDSSRNSTMWRRSPERRPVVDDGEQRQTIERNILRIVDKRTTQRAVFVLVKTFGLEKVSEAFDFDLGGGSSVQNTNSSSFPRIGTLDLPVHQISLDPTATSISSAPHHPSSVDSSWSRLNEGPEGPLGADLGTGSSEPQYKKPITEASWGDSHEDVEEKNEDSIVEEVEPKHQSQILRRNSESQSIASCQTQETTIHDFTFPERISHEIREITTASHKVAIVVSTQEDGKTLEHFLAAKGYQTKLISKGDLDNDSYDHIIYSKQVVIVPIEDWKRMTKEHKQKTTYLIVSLREGQTDGSISDFQEFHQFEGLQHIPFVREELPRTCSSISDEMPDIPLRQIKQQKSHPTLLETPSKPAPLRTPVYQSVSSQTVTVTRTVSVFKQETASQMFDHLRSFAKQVISELTMEAKAQGIQDFEELSHEHDKSYDNFINQLSNWIAKVDKKKILGECIRLNLLKETVRAVNLVYLVGSENTKALIGPSISKIYEQLGRVCGPDQADVKAINRMEEIMDSPPESFNYEETTFFQGLIEKLKDWQDLRPFHGVVIVHSRINIWAISELLGRHPEFKERTIFSLYSPSKDTNHYGANKELKMTKSRRSEVLQDFNQSDCGILVTVSVQGIETELTNVDLLILFGCTSAVQADSIQATKKWNIEIGFGTTGRIAEIT